MYSLERGDNTRGDLLAKQAETELALRAGADVVFQATFFDGEFLGYADFIVNEAAGTGTPGRYEVWDTKLARHAKVGALLQLAAYGDQLIGMGLDPSPRVTLVLGAVVDGDYVRSHHSLPDLLPVFRERRDRFRRPDRRPPGARVRRCSGSSPASPTAAGATTAPSRSRPTATS